jgi:hypothetical protein
MTVLLGAIADDFTGATDLCNTLVRRGMRTVQLIGVPAPGTEIADAEAVVVALKSRTIPAAEAIDKSLAALASLREAGARQIMFKYCSTFDSTDEGNIGPVAEALMDVLGTDFTLFCPAFPEAGRTIYHGYLFVGDVLLSESGMRDHPLTPMRDPSLVRVLQRQCRGNVGLVPQYDVARGAAAIRDAFASLHQAGFRHAIVDAIEDHDLAAIGEAAADFPLITGGSGIALGLPDNFRRRGLLGDGGAADALPPIADPAAVLSGSCSDATRAQVAYNDGRLVSGDPPTKESFLHRVMYEERPATGAVVHLHSTHSVAVSCLAEIDPADVLPPITAYYVMRVGRLPLVPYYRPGDLALAEAVRGFAGKHHAVLLANHGPVVAGSDLDVAVNAIEELEETAKLFLLLRGAKTHYLTAAQVKELQ